MSAMPSKFCFTVAFKQEPSLIICTLLIFVNTGNNNFRHVCFCQCLCGADVASSSHAAKIAITESLSGFAVQRVSRDLFFCVINRLFSRYILFSDQLNVGIFFNNVIKWLHNVLQHLDVVCGEITSQYLYHLSRSSKR